MGWQKAESGAAADDGQLELVIRAKQSNTIAYIYIIFLFFFFCIFPLVRAVCLDLKTQPAEVDKTPRESNILSLFSSHCTPLYSMSHLSSYHSATHTYIFQQFSTTREKCSNTNSNMCCILGIIQMKKMHYILGYLYSYLLAFS